MEDCLVWVGPHTGAGKECEESSPEEEGAEATYDELTTAPICLPTMQLVCGEGRENGE